MWRTRILSRAGRELVKISGERRQDVLYVLQGGSELKLFTLRAPAEARPEARIRKSSFFLCFSWIFWPKTWFLKSRDPGGHSYQARARETSSRPISWRKRVKNLSTIKKILTKTIYFSKNQAPGPFPNERSWNFASIGAMDTSVRPNLTDFVTKTCKKPVKMKVSNSSRHFPRVYRGFPTLSNPSRGSSMMSEGSQPVAQTLHACQETTDHRVSAKNCSKSVGTKLMTSNWWLMIDHWSWMIDDW